MNYNFTDGDERVMRELGKMGTALGVTVVQSSSLFVPKRSDMPLVRLAWRDPFARADALPNHIIHVGAVATDFSFPAKAAGSHGGTTGTTLKDAAQDFIAGTPGVAVGDAIRNLTSEEDGTVTEVKSATELVCTISFDEDDEYEVHWPTDALVEYQDDHEASVYVDLYADPGASYADGWPIEKLMRAVRQWLWMDGRDLLQAVSVDIKRFEGVANLQGIIGGGFPDDDYARWECELVIAIGGSMVVRRPTVETIVVTSPHTD